MFGGDALREECRRAPQPKIRSTTKKDFPEVLNLGEALRNNRQGVPSSLFLKSAEVFDAFVDAPQGYPPRRKT